MQQLELKVKQSKKDNSSEVELSVEAPAELAEKLYAKALRDISTKVDLPGFRKGKVPKDIIEKQFGANYISQKAFEEEFSALLFQVSEQEKLSIVEVIEILSYQILPGKPLSLKVVVELKPEVKLGKYKGLKVKAKKTLFDKDAFIKKTIERLSANFITFQEVTSRALKEGDLVNLTFEGTFDDGSPVPGGKAENFDVMFEKDKFLPDFIDKLKGSKQGITKDITVTFPDNYAQDLSGKKANFKVQINKIQEKVLPKIDDAFAKNFGLENLSQLNEKILEQMDVIQQSNHQKEMENTIVETVDKSSKYEISERMAEKEVDILLKDLKASHEQQGLKWDDFKADPKNKELLSKAREAAKKRIAIDLILAAIIHKESISVPPDELKKEVENRASQMQDNKNMKDDQRFAGLVEYVMLRNKAVDFLVKNNEVEWEEEVTKDIPE